MSRPTRPMLLSALSTTVTPVADHPTGVASLHIANAGGAVAFVQFFNKKRPADVTLGTTVPDAVAAVGASGVTSFNPEWLFDVGLQVAAATTATGSAAPASAQVVQLGLNE